MMSSFVEGFDRDVQASIGTPCGWSARLQRLAGSVCAAITIVVNAFIA
jgi:hypothetical protein